MSPRIPIQSLDVKVGGITQTQLSVVAELQGGQRVDAATVLSEANRDLVAVLLMVAVARARVSLGESRGSTVVRVLILDDVFQSVDASVRTGAMRHIAGELGDWQLIVTCHDRLWREQVRRIFLQSGATLRQIELSDWTPGRGPKAVLPQAPRERLLSVVRDGDPSHISREAGYLLESLLQDLSWRLQSSVIRRPDDRYTLGDLWPSILKTLKKTAVAPLAQAVGENAYLRNVAGAHYNEFAQSLSVEEGRKFADDVIALWDALNCQKCGDFVEKMGERYSCRCHAVVL